VIELEVEVVDLIELVEDEDIFEDFSAVFHLAKALEYSGYKVLYIWDEADGKAYNWKTHKWVSDLRKEGNYHILVGNDWIIVAN